MGSDTETATGEKLGAVREKLLTAALGHVAFDGWSTTALKAAMAETGTDPAMARLAFPRGGLDMALAFHDLAERWLDEDLAGQDLGEMRIRDRVTHCVRRRVELVADHREAVRRAAALLALPLNAPEGARAIWRTADHVWRLCGDTSTDYNWYTKRAILGSVYSATVLYWLGDQDPRAAATWEFLDRRIEDVMRFEKTKASIEQNPVARAVFWGPRQVLGMVRAPRSATADPQG